MNKILDFPLPVHRLSFKDIPTGIDSRLWRVNHSDIKTLQDMFISAASTPSLAALIQSESFWKCKSVTGPENSFVRQYFLFKMGPQNNCLVMPLYLALATCFAELGLSKSNVYSNALDNFRLVALRHLIPSNRGQRKAVSQIHLILKNNQDAFDLFPIADIIVYIKSKNNNFEDSTFLRKRLSFRDPQPLLSTITLGHAALLSSVSAFLRSQE